MPNAINIKGKKFGSFTVIEKLPSKNKKTYWLCQCECGNYKEIQTSHLVSQRCLSCNQCGKRTKTKLKYCAQCGKPLGVHQYKFCSSNCATENKYTTYINRWKSGEETGKKGKSISMYVRRYILQKYDGKCCKCGWNEINQYLGASFLEIHHKDGNRDNNSEENLELLCPNCHSLTKTYRSLNNKNN